MVTSYFIFAGVNNNQFLVCEELTGCVTKSMTLSVVIISYDTLLVLVSILNKYFSDTKLSIYYTNIEILTFFMTVNFISYEISNLITIQLVHGIRTKLMSNLEQKMFYTKR